MTTEFDDEDLVAYLDGELSSELTQQIHEKLSSHPDLKDRVDRLRMTWDLLDELPTEPLSPRFAETTIELAALTSDIKPKSILNWLLANSSRLVLLAVPLLFLGGFASTKYNQSRDERQLLNDLPLLADWRSLLNMDSKWLEALVQNEDLVSTFTGEEINAVGDGNVPIELDLRRVWIEKLSDVDRGRLRVNLSEFQQRTRSRQSELRELIAELYSDPDKKEKYLSAARSYELLLQEQSMTQRAGLSDLDLDDRMNEVVHLISIRMSMDYAKNIPVEDAEAINAWAEDMTEKHFLIRNADALQSVYFELIVNFASSEISIEDYENLVSRLSHRANHILMGLKNEVRVDALVDWIEALARPQKQKIERVSPDKLKEIYRGLSAGLDEIDLMQPAQAKEKLLRASSKPRAGLPPPLEPNKQ